MQKVVLRDGQKFAVSAVRQHEIYSEIGKSCMTVAVKACAKKKG
jgi:hypothetical protein